MENERNEQAFESVGREDGAQGFDAPPACPACGGEARRAGARFCATCGRGLDDEGYLPSDAIRSSYHYQQQRPPVSVPKRAPAALKPSHDERRGVRRVSLFAQNRNAASQTALAFVTYALVPYLGILFCPGALVMGGLGLLHARRLTQADDGRRASLMSILLSLLIFAAQLFLWWILYKVPEWTQATK
ncbi:MAG TPA: hypothetical protein VGB73_06220 [Pyrinomonadaceae bacterium]|jgi:hypothetical protein